MNLLIKIVVGGVAGWLSGKVVESEERGNVARERHVVDTILGIAGALIGDYLFFWIVITKGSVVSDFATAILGSITVVGLSRLLISRAARS